MGRHKKSTLKSLKARAKILIAVRDGIKSASAIYKQTNIEYVEVHRHLIALTNEGQVICRQVHKRPRGKALFNEYDFVCDRDNLIEQYGDMQTKMPILKMIFYARCSATLMLSQQKTAEFIQRTTLIASSARKIHKLDT
jgi:hypothetical protein